MQTKKEQYLAYKNKTKPVHLQDIIGQPHITANGSTLQTWLAHDTLPHIIFYGVAGIGKTSIARCIANTTNRPFTHLNATQCNKKDYVDAIKQAEDGHILFIDEIHRLTTPIQDLLLPHMEEGLITFIGATTENPYHACTPAIRSRMQLIPLHTPTVEDAMQLIDKTRDIYENITQTTRTIDEAVRHTMAQQHKHDFRKLVDTCWYVYDAVAPNEHIVKAEHYQRIMPHIQVLSDKQGDMYYNILSALQKSIRGSDADAAVFYTAQAIQIGEFESIIRRCIVTAYEDIGLADPQAVQYAVQCLDQAKGIGLPEARILLSYAVITLALAKKSNHAYEAINNALTQLQKETYPIPPHLHDGHYQGADAMKQAHAMHTNETTTYLYPHAYENHIVKQQYLPSALQHVEWIQTPQTHDAWVERLTKLRHYLRQ